MDNINIKNIFECKSLTLEEKSVFLYLSSISLDNKTVEVSYKVISEAIGKSKVSVIRYVKGLVDKGLIEVEKNVAIDGGLAANLYVLNLDIIKGV